MNSLTQFFFVIGLVFSSSSALFAAPDPKELTPCHPAREWVTAVEFFRKSKGLGLSDPDALKLADQVASGCQGSAARMIRILHLLQGAEIDSRSALQMGLEFAAKSDQEADHFRIYFRTLFASDSLDLDARAALALARSLTLELDSQPDWVKKDFERLTKYCLNESQLNWPRPTCGEFSVRVTRLSAKVRHEVSSDWIDLYEFLTQEKAGSLPRSQASALAEEIIGLAPKAGPNFIQSFKYAASKDGLALTTKNALEVARRISGLAKTQ